VRRPQAFKQNIGLLFGDVGTDKSFAAGCIANALPDADIPVLMTNFPIILARLCGMFGEDRTDFLDSLGDYDLLIIDDLGAERNTEYALEQMFSVIDSRYRCADRGHKFESSGYSVRKSVRQWKTSNGGRPGQKRTIVFALAPLLSLKSRNIGGKMNIQKASDSFGHSRAKTTESNIYSHSSCSYLYLSPRFTL
jgi:hypothetical protein